MNTMPETSREAYHSLDSDDIKTLHKKILAALGEMGQGTFEDIALFLKMPPERIWKRMSELRKEKLIHRPGGKKMLKSRRNGFIWALGDGDDAADESQRKKQTTPLSKTVSNIQNIGSKIQIEWDFD